MPKRRRPERFDLRIMVAKERSKNVQALVFGVGRKMNSSEIIECSKIINQALSSKIIDWRKVDPAIGALKSFIAEVKKAKIYIAKTMRSLERLGGFTEEVNNLKGIIEHHLKTNIIEDDVRRIEERRGSKN